MAGGTGGASAARAGTLRNHTEWRCAGRYITCACIREMQRNARACIREMQRNAYEARRVAEIVETVRRTVKPHECQCGTSCLRGDDHDECSISATVDIEPVDRLGETIALIDGLNTYDISPQKGPNSHAGAFVLYYREPWHIKSAKRAHPVLVEHRCRKAAS